VSAKVFNVIGAGLAGSEAALVLARSGAKVRLFEQKPKAFSAAHKLPGAAELVCSNSMKSLEVTSSSGLLKQELLMLGSPVIQAALECRVPGGKSLSVDREKFSAHVTSLLQENEQIEMCHEVVEKIPTDDPTLIASGPLTADALMQDIFRLAGDQGLYFYDATSPVVTLESLDLSKFFWGSRNQDNDDYLNLPLTKEEYLAFREKVLGAEKFESHLPGEDLKFFEGCLPIEVLAERGEDVMACSCMRPKGFDFKSPEGRRAYAVIQFRRERAAGELLSMVAFQTRMKWPEQERVLRSLPGMENAQFVRLGVMHRNSFINAPLHLTHDLAWKIRADLFSAGQIIGSEGYVEAVSTGHYAARSMLGLKRLPEETAMRSLVRFLVDSDTRYFQPMNFNFGLLPALEVEVPRKRPQGKSAKMFRNELRAERALNALRISEAIDTDHCTILKISG